MNASLYIHVPYCLKKCDYCDFYSVPSSRDSGFSPYIETVVKEIASRKRLFGVDRWSTVYVGGGSPSLLSPMDIRALSEGIRPDLANDGEGATEWTIEANPEDLSLDWLRACEESGINRLSLGLQSLRDPALAAIGRRGSAALNLAALELAAANWNGRLSVDFIAGLPGLTDGELTDDLRRALEYGPDHVSLYSLTIEEGTPLSKRILAKSIEMPDEDAAAAQWIAGRDYLESNGLLQYEVSNFARPGCESRHNLTYWTLQSYVGVGPGATGTIRREKESFRYTDNRDIAAWMRDPTANTDNESISAVDTLAEAILMGFRLTRGVDRNAFKDRFDVDLATKIKKTAIKWQKKGLLEVSETRMNLNQEGLLVLNRFLVDCLEELCDD
ncbi:MAG TPA: radical SAM family heme chaperone HemW [Treponemataceae bacterium]|nr:radical SAM family heme chaperone HemW [Treponemataceae bacterium]